MSNLLSLTFALLAGILLGAIFFGGLWWTVRKGITAEYPALWFLGSLLLRMCIVMLGFYYLVGDNWQRLMAGLLGFIVARLIVTRFTRMTSQSEKLAQEAAHAP